MQRTVASVYFSHIYYYYYYYYYHRWHRLTFCRFHHRDANLKYDIRSAFRCDSTRESSQLEDRMIKLINDHDHHKTNVARRSWLSPQFNMETSYFKEVSPREFYVQPKVTRQTVWYKQLLKIKPLASTSRRDPSQSPRTTGCRTPQRFSYPSPYAGDSQIYLSYSATYLNFSYCTDLRTGLNN